MDLILPTVFFAIYFVVPSYVLADANAGPVGDLEVFYVKECDPPVEDYELVTNLKTLDNGNKALDIYVNLPFDIDDLYEFLLVIDKWEDGAWQTDTYRANGGLFSYLKQYVPKLFESIRNRIQPPIESDSFIPAGEYTLEDLEEVAESVELPQILYGRLRVTMSIVYQGEEKMCRTVEGISSSKD